MLLQRLWAHLMQKQTSNLDWYNHLTVYFHPSKAHLVWVYDGSKLEMRWYPSPVSKPQGQRNLSR